MAFKLYGVRVTSLLIFFVTLANAQNSMVHQINADDTKTCCSTKDKLFPMPPIYCYAGSEKSLLNVFQTITVDLTIDKSDDFIIYQADDENSVEEQMVSDEATLTLNKVISYFWKQRDFKLHPFQRSCFSIKTNADYKIRTNSIALDSKRLTLFVVGVLLFAYSAQLSHNLLFYYLCGITIGVTTSFFIIILFVSRFIPKKQLMFGYLGASCMLSLYAVQMLVENLNMLLMLYYKFILGYIIFSMLVSFVICYRCGPVTNPKSINLIKWTLQLIGLAMVTLCSFHLEAMVLVDILSIIFYYTKFSLPKTLFPKSKPKARLLSDEEYVLQGLTETPKALEELRKYCQSPNCNSWKVINKLSDPKKFADFIETSAHVSSEAIKEYEREMEYSDLDDESEEENSDSMDGINEINYTSDSE